ncbi:unnamed protein product [Lymnaea stagnalis]|uniref:Uncharacterized protein n=1 Tax=Lymnaea stagnalis TaxID=6523 RepID=A0AAV2I7E9_LYMST
MASDDLVTKQTDIFKNLQENIGLVSLQIKDGESKREEPSDFNRDQYWNNVAAIFKVLSMETTKLSLAFSKKPFPSNKNTEALVHELEKSMLALVSIYYSLPISQGKTLRCQFQQTVLQILESLERFVSSLSDCVNSLNTNGDQRIQWTGGVWDAVSLELLKDNKECASKCLKETFELVTDALEELDQAILNEGVEDEFSLNVETPSTQPWSEQDITVLKTSSGLVKTMKNVIKKAQESVEKHGDTESREGIATLDELVTLTSEVSRVVDDLVSGIYAEVNYETFTNNGEILSELIRNILKFLRDSNLTQNEDSKWLDFLTHACSHNLEKLKENVLPKL